jgi:hypothetical protein
MALNPARQLDQYSAEDSHKVNPFFARYHSEISLLSFLLLPYHPTVPHPDHLVYMGSCNPGFHHGLHRAEIPEMAERIFRAT